MGNRSFSSQKASPARAEEPARLEAEHRRREQEAEAERRRIEEEAKKRRVEEEEGRRRYQLALERDLRGMARRWAAAAHVRAFPGAVWRLAETLSSTVLIDVLEGKRYGGRKMAKTTIKSSIRTVEHTIQGPDGRVSGHVKLTGDAIMWGRRDKKKWWTLSIEEFAALMTDKDRGTATKGVVPRPWR
jgi:hypothetical protein